MKKEMVKKIVMSLVGIGFIVTLLASSLGLLAMEQENQVITLQMQQITKDIKKVVLGAKLATTLQERQESTQAILDLLDTPVVKKDTTQEFEEVLQKNLDELFQKSTNKGFDLPVNKKKHTKKKHTNRNITTDFENYDDDNSTQSTSWYTPYVQWIKKNPYKVALASVAIGTTIAVGIYNYLYR